jgi:hypothetical protein
MWMWRHKWRTRFWFYCNRLLVCCWIFFLLIFKFVFNEWKMYNMCSSLLCNHIVILEGNAWLDSKVCKLIALKVLHTSLLKTTAVTFIVLPLGSYALIPVPSPPFKTIWNWFCGMAFRAAVMLLLMSSVSSICLHFNISFIFGNKKKSLGDRSSE